MKRLIILECLQPKEESRRYCRFMQEISGHGHMVRDNRESSTVFIDNEFSVQFQKHRLLASIHNN